MTQKSDHKAEVDTGESTVGKSDVLSALQKELDRHPQGISALALSECLVDQGYSPYTAERAIQRALDSGTVELGPQLELQSTAG